MKCKTCYDLTCSCKLYSIVSFKCQNFKQLIIDISCKPYLHCLNASIIAGQFMFVLQLLCYAPIRSMWGVQLTASAYAGVSAGFWISLTRLSHLLFLQFCSIVRELVQFVFSSYIFEKLFFILAHALMCFIFLQESRDPQLELSILFCNSSQGL